MNRPDAHKGAFGQIAEELFGSPPAPRVTLGDIAAGVVAVCLMVLVVAGTVLGVWAMFAAVVG